MMCQTEAMIEEPQLVDEPIVVEKPQEATEVELIIPMVTAELVYALELPQP